MSAMEQIRISFARVFSGEGRGTPRILEVRVGLLASDKSPKHNGEGIDVGLFAVVLMAENLGRHVNRLHGDVSEAA